MTCPGPRRLFRARTPILAALCAAIPLLLAACTTIPTESTTDSPAAPPEFEHVHELSFAETGELLIATHHGIYVLDSTTGASEMVGEVAFDAMGMASSGAAVYVSGHPGTETDEVFVAPNIGLARYTEDAGWESIALAGQTDFHALAATPANPDLIVGLPSDRPVLAVSTDGGRNWSDAAQIEARDVIIDAADPKSLLATTAEGVQVSRDQGASFAPLPGAPLLVIAAPDAAQHGGFVGVDTTGAVWSGTTHAAASAKQIGQADGEVAAIARDHDTGTIALVDERGIVTTTDEGKTWTVALPAQ